MRGDGPPRGGRVAGWARHHIPTREGIEGNRFLKPVAHRILVPSLWRFNRRSVPRGVALGMFCGVIFPFAHMALAAVLSLPARANVPVAVGSTLVNNPITFVPLMAAAYQIGSWLLSLDRVVPGHPIATDLNRHADWLHRLVAHGAPALIVGLLALALILSAAGYLVTSVGWRWHMARKWRNRHAARGK
ncbi:DUF2062 domain-containing protein [uncultured Sphingomonas sp.]|uniref:DUF2062 domain-containing protein n=1 Tax=uncultured Sphingomonas sp. TaxID=158754 RepID=UPI0035CB0427